MEAGSPFRGLRYCWELGEASYAFRQRRYDQADQIVSELLQSIGIATLLPRLGADNAGLVSISTAIDNRTASMQFRRSVFERRARQSIAAVQAALGAELRQDTVCGLEGCRPLTPLAVRCMADLPI